MINEIKTIHAPHVERRLKVAAYARISHNKDELENSLENQIRYYTTIIKNHPEWEFAGIYADDGISGGTIVKRNQFQLMINKAFANQIDIILVKSISRFARNLMDMLNVIQELRDVGVEVYFEKEGISTLDTKSDNYLTLYSKFAEEELISMSRNVRWSIEKKMEEGRFFFDAARMFGFRFDDNRNIVINETEAKWIRLIFQMYVDGENTATIADVLEENGVRTYSGMTRWTSSSIRRVLRNEKYCGNVLLQKSYSESPMTHKKIINRGERKQCLLEDVIPAIVSKEIWRKAQERMKQNAIQFKIGHKVTQNLWTAYTQFGWCPHCRNNYYRKFNRGTEMLYCSSNKDRCLCRESESVYVGHLNEIIAQQIRILKSNEPEFRKWLIDEFSNEDVFKEYDESIAKINKDIEELQTKLDSFGSLSGEAFDAVRNQIRKQINELNDNKAIIENEKLTIMNPENRAAGIIKELRGMPDADSIGDADFRKIFSKLIIVNRDRLIFVIGSDDMNKIPFNPQSIPMAFTGLYKYKVRSTYFTTTFGICINN